MNWSNLPSEILFAALIQLDLRSLLRCSSACKSWRLNISDDHYWKNLYNVDYPYDNTTPYENQTWRFIYIRKAKVFKAIEIGNVYIKNIIASHEEHFEYNFIGPSVSMYKDNVIATCSTRQKVLGCHAKNIYTEEVSKQLGKSWYSKVIGDYLLSFNVDGYFQPEWHTLNATKISSDISDIKFSSERNIPWHDQPFKLAIFNADQTFTEVIGVDVRFGNSVLYNWLTNEKTDLIGKVIGTPIAFHKNTLLTKTGDTLNVYQNFERVHKLNVEFDIKGATLNENLIVCSTEKTVWIFDRRNEYAVFKLKEQYIFTLFLFDDLLVYRKGLSLKFFNVNARKLLGTVIYRGKSFVHHVIRHSANEFIMQTEDTAMLLRFDIKPSTMSVMHVTASGEMKEITTKSTNLLALATQTVKACDSDVHSSYVMKKPGDKRYVMLFNSKPAKKDKPNVKANELLQEYIRVASGHLYMPFCPYTTSDASNVPENMHHSVKLDRDFEVRGDVIIYCEQIINGKSELVKPDKWPTELYTKTIGEDKNNNTNNKKPKKKK